SRLVTVGDFDGSGPDDVVALEAVAGTTISAHWSGPVTVGFVAYRSWWPGETRAAVRADLDEDGFDDIVTVSPDLGLGLARGGPSEGMEGDLIACVASITTMLPGATLVAAGDLDGDGRPDLAISDGIAVVLLVQTR
ncbi:MAG: VCBS repeat-containing protein, partial [Deltaproteobacteria bacterium]|nr:VCBS repeat-containing protein [Nannocystaceae bacterium]